jgi:hypothetical protein
VAKTEEGTIISAQVPESTRLELIRRAEAGYRSMSAEIRLALDEHLEREATTCELERLVHDRQEQA